MKGQRGNAAQIPNTMEETGHPNSWAILGPNFASCAAKAGLHPAISIEA